MITFDDFAKVEMRVGLVLEAEEVVGSDKLLKLKVDFGEAGLPAGRQVLSGIKKWYKPQNLIGKQFIFVTNLEPRTMMGLESQGMIMAVGEEKPILLKPVSKIPAGSKVR